MIAVKLRLSDRSRRVVEDWQQAAPRLGEALDRAIDEVLNLAEATVLREELSGTFAKSERRGGQGPVAARSGALKGSLRTARDDRLSGFVGVGRGPASRYAHVVLGEGTTTIRPKMAEHLWIPLPDNQTAQGETRLSPRAAFERTGPRGGRRLRIFESSRGNLLAFLAEGGRYQRGPRKGMSRGKLLFALKDSVEVEGTDGLVRGVTSASEGFDRIFNRWIESAMPGGEA